MIATTATSASWLSRSPNSEMSWPGPQRRERAVEREPDVWVLPDALDGLEATGAGSVTVTGAGRSAASASKRRQRRRGHARRRRCRGPAAARGRRRRSGPATGRSRRPDRRPAAGGREAARSSRRVADGRELLPRRAPAGRGRRREQEEGEAEGQEDVADRGDVLDDREGDRDDVGERPEVEQEVRVERRRQDRSGATSVTSAGVRPASCEARHPDRHVAAVDQDHDGVGRTPTNARLMPG